MVAPNRPDPDADPFRPPEIPTEVHCLHCDEEYDSYRIEWREEVGADGQLHGFWCCPTPGCDGKGFGFDILPTDPTYQDERGGWVSFDDDDDEFDDEDEQFDDELDEEFDEDFDECGLDPEDEFDLPGDEDDDVGGADDEGIPF